MACVICPRLNAYEDDEIRDEAGRIQMTLGTGTEYEGEYENTNVELITDLEYNITALQHRSFQKQAQSRWSVVQISNMVRGHVVISYLKYRVIWHIKTLGYKTWLRRIRPFGFLLNPRYQLESARRKLQFNYFWVFPNPHVLFSQVQFLLPYPYHHTNLLFDISQRA